MSDEWGDVPLALRAHHSSSSLPLQFRSLDAPRRKSPWGKAKRNPGIRVEPALLFPRITACGLHPGYGIVVLGDG
jgi:hypothetical protein